MRGLAYHLRYNPHERWEEARQDVETLSALRGRTRPNSVFMSDNGLDVISARCGLQEANVAELW